MRRIAADEGSVAEPLPLQQFCFAQVIAVPGPDSGEVIIAIDRGKMSLIGPIIGEPMTA